MSHNPHELQNLLDRVKTAAFLNDNSAFLGSLMCQIKEFIWDETVKTAETDGVNLWWNPNWFLQIPEATRKSVLIHELWHIGRLHTIRRGERDPEDWNKACDYVINNGMDDDGYTFDGTNPLIDHRFDGMCEEEVYDLIHADAPRMPADWTPDLLEPEDRVINDLVSQVVMATQQAHIMGQAGNLPGQIQITLDTFLKPVLPWEQLLYRFMEELSEEEFSWLKRNRRYSDTYMPGIRRAEDGLNHLAYFVDASGSVSDYDILRFNSEIKYIKDQLKPNKLSLIVFDTKIREVIVFDEDDTFDKVVITGRGGTSLVCVREWIQTNRPTAAVIFTDMECAPMDRPTPPIPVLWVVTGTRGHSPSYGQVIKLTAK